MKIVTYNVNGLRQRTAQYGSLRRLLDSFDADIICFQETKLRKQDLTTDLAMADGYESFFSCTRTVAKGRSGYSGVATFCRVKAAFSSTEVALPVSAEEGFTGALSNCSTSLKNESVRQVAPGMEELCWDDLVKVDSEGRCMITDHGHFVLFNIYGPRADCTDEERVQFKLNFYHILQRRCECLLDEGRRIFLVGDLNIAPTSLDRCDAGPDFDSDVFRKWFRSMLRKSGGKFSDCFRTIYPDRTGAYTCWPTNTGAEQFNYGTRIDHILCSGTCLHENYDTDCHEFIKCHVQDCDILTEYKRWNAESTPSGVKWKGGLGIKLVGSDHAPVFVNLVDIPSINPHSTPPLSSRYLPMFYGLQQTLDSVLKKRLAMPQVASSMCLASVSEENASEAIWETCKPVIDFPGNCCTSNSLRLSSKDVDWLRSGTAIKRGRICRSSQSTLKSFFSKVPNSQIEASACHESRQTSTSQEQNCGLVQYLSDSGENCLKQGEVIEKRKNNTALLEWQRIQRHMQNSLPLCKGHKEPCVSRVVKKPGPTLGHRFYVCARAEGPSSNPETNCSYFKWASSTSRSKQGS